MAQTTRDNVLAAFSRIHSNSLAIIDKTIKRSLLIGIVMFIVSIIIGTVIENAKDSKLVEGYTAFLHMALATMLAFAFYLSKTKKYKNYLTIHNFIKGSRDDGIKVGGRDWYTLELFESELSNGEKISPVNIRRLVNEAAALMLLEENLKENKVFISHKDENIDYEASFLPMIEKTIAEFR